MTKGTHCAFIHLDSLFVLGLKSGSCLHLARGNMQKPVIICLKLLVGLSSGRDKGTVRPLSACCPHQHADDVCRRLELVLNHWLHWTAVGGEEVSLRESPCVGCRGGSGGMWLPAGHRSNQEFSVGREKKKKFRIKARLLAVWARKVPQI